MEVALEEKNKEIEMLKSRIGSQQAAHAALDRKVASVKEEFAAFMKEFDLGNRAGM